MSQQLLYHINRTTTYILVKFDTLLLLFGYHQYPKKSLREIRVSPEDILDREYLYYTNNFSGNEIKTTKYNLVTFLPR